MDEQLVRWLDEQFNVDERIARAACWDEQSDVWTARPPQEPWDPARVLREIDAKRRIVELHGPADTEYADGPVCTTCDDLRGVEPAYPCRTLRLLLLPYADRPGYSDEWRP
ncbi:DUF6221 family protein [Streptomyces sp. NPDC002343]